LRLSWVINDEPFVAEATHAKVVAAMQELGYVPNASARRLASGRSPVVGLVFHSATWNYINDVQYEMARHLLSLGYKHIAFVMGNALSLAYERRQAARSTHPPAF
jgi:LacI family transcriptional regulator